MTLPYRYRRLAYVALNVSDLDRSSLFYRDLLGLAPSTVEAGFSAFRCSRDHHNVLLYRSDRAGIKRMAFELESPADLAAARAHLAQHDIAVEPVAADELKQLRIADAFRFHLPGSGLCVEFLVRMMQLATPYQPSVTRIERLGHVGLNVLDLQGTQDFLTEVLGFRLSDYVPGFAAFFRCHPNPLHHSFTIVAGQANQLNHVNFMVTDIDDIGRALNRMKAAKVEIVFGPGRHQPSESIFLYFLDPDGMTLEYSFGMELFPEQGAREPRFLQPVPEALDMWGSRPTERFGRCGDIEPAVAGRS